MVIFHANPESWIIVVPTHLSEPEDSKIYEEVLSSWRTLYIYWGNLLSFLRSQLIVVFYNHLHVHCTSPPSSISPVFQHFFVYLLPFNLDHYITSLIYVTPSSAWAEGQPVDGQPVHFCENNTHWLIFQKWRERGSVYGNLIGSRPAVIPQIDPPIQFWIGAGPDRSTWGQSVHWNLCQNFYNLD